MNRKQEEALANYGLNIGIAFQLVDDALDYRNAKSVWGKQLGKDFMEGKATLPLIRVYRVAPEKDRERLRALFDQETRTEADYLEALM